MIRTDFTELQRQAFARPFVGPEDIPGCEFIVPADEGWFVGLSVNH